MLRNTGQVNQDVKVQEAAQPFEICDRNGAGFSGWLPRSLHDPAPPPASLRALSGSFRGGAIKELGTSHTNRMVVSTQVDFAVRALLSIIRFPSGAGLWPSAFILGCSRLLTTCHDGAIHSWCSLLLLWTTLLSSARKRTAVLRRTLHMRLVLNSECSRCLQGIGTSQHIIRDSSVVTNGYQLPSKVTPLNTRYEKLFQQDHSTHACC